MSNWKKMEKKKSRVLQNVRFAMLRLAQHGSPLCIRLRRETHGYKPGQDASRHRAAPPHRSWCLSKVAKYGHIWSTNVTYPNSNMKAYRTRLRLLPSCNFFTPAQPSSIQLHNAHSMPLAIWQHRIIFHSRLHANSNQLQLSPFPAWLSYANSEIKTWTSRSIILHFFPSVLVYLTWPLDCRGYGPLSTSWQFLL